MNSAQKNKKMWKILYSLRFKSINAFPCFFEKIIVTLHPNLGNLNNSVWIAASVSEGFCTLIHGWEGEIGLPV